MERARHGILLNFPATCRVFCFQLMHVANNMGNAARSAENIPEHPFKVPIPSPLMTDARRKNRGQRCTFCREDPRASL